MPACHERKEILGTLLKKMYASKFQKKRKPMNSSQNRYMIASPERKENQKQIIKKGKPKTDQKVKKFK